MNRWFMLKNTQRSLLDLRGNLKQLAMFTVLQTGYGYKRGSQNTTGNKVWDSNKNSVIEKRRDGSKPSF